MHGILNRARALIRLPCSAGGIILNGVMGTKSRTPRVVRCLYRINELAAWIGYTTIAGIILIVFVDVCGRYLLNKPLVGSYELVEQAMITLGGLAIMYAAVKGGHVAVDILVARFTARAQVLMQRIFSLLGSVTWIIIAYGVYRDACSAMKSSQTMVSFPSVSLAPFLFLLAAGLFLCSLTLLLQALHPVVPEQTPAKEERI